MRNVFLIVLSLFMTSTVVFSGFRLYRRALVNAVYDLHYQLHTVIQTGPEKEALPTLYLMELLELSMDKPQNYVTFDEKVAEKKILQSPVIRSARVKKRKPDTVYVDYEVYKPVALWKDKTNMALSEEGHPFPIRPYFSEKTLPEIYFGSETILQEKWVVASAILSALPHATCIDVSLSDHESFGKREIVVYVDGWYLRLTPHKFAEELACYATLKESTKGKKIVDLRLTNVAYLEDL